MKLDLADSLRPLLDCLTDGICIADAKGKLLYANLAAGRILGMTPEEASAGSMCELLCERLKGDEGAPFECPLRVPGGPEDAVTFRGRYHPPRGAAGAPEPEARSVRVRCLRVRQAHGERHFLVLEDASRSVDASRRREEWRHMFAHDLLSPLTNVLAVLRVIEDDGSGYALTAHDLEMIRLAVRSCERITELLDGYLTVARMEAGAMPLRLVPTDAGRLLRSCASAEEENARARRVSLETSAPEGVTASADPELLRRVLLNLTDNALKFTPAGGRVRVSALREGPEVVLRVEDDGPGIPAEDLPRVFDRFYQSKAAGRDVGFGLGLTFCREAVRAMGGTVTAESVFGEGSSFTVRLPAAPPPTPPPGSAR